MVIEKATIHTDYYTDKVVSCEDRESHGHTVFCVRTEKATSHTDYCGDRESYKPHRLLYG